MVWFGFMAYQPDELIRDVLLWTPTHGRAKAGRSARTYIQQLSADTGCSSEDLPETMDDRFGWRKRVRDIRATSATWWWWYTFIYINPKKKKKEKKEKRKSPQAGLPDNILYPHIVVECMLVLVVLLLHGPLKAKRQSRPLPSGLSKGKVKVGVADNAISETNTHSR